MIITLQSVQPMRLSFQGDSFSEPAMTIPVHDDASDLRLALSGDEAAFARLYERHSAVVLALCRRHAPMEPDDALQETFIRACTLLHKVSDPSRLRPWLYGIARRVCSEKRRSQRRRTHHTEQAMSERMAQLALVSANQHSGGGQWSGESDRCEQLAQLSKALDQLPDRERLAIHLYYLETDPVTAATSALGLSRSAYYKLLARARDHLAAVFQGVQQP
jgi:RNA polymerase sigma factor (sigma-70 family)